MAVNPKATELIDRYFDRLPDWPRHLCIKLRAIIHKASPSIVEDWKWGQPAFLLNGKQLCWIWPFQHHVSFVFYQGSLMKDSLKLFNSGEKNIRNRTIKFTIESELDEKVLLKYTREAVELNSTGKFVKIPVTQDRTIVIPSFIKHVLEMEGLLKKYNEQIYTYRKGYVQWIIEAKLEETRKKRIRQMIKELQEDKEYMGMPRSSN